jgi:hypothetical protein
MCSYKLVEVRFDMVYMLQARIEEFVQKVSIKNPVHSFIVIVIRVDDFVFAPELWIWIRIVSGFSDFVDPDPYWESGSGFRGKKIKRFHWKKCTFY